jgi:hypothetical protein
MTDPRNDSGQMVVVRQRRGEGVRRLLILLVFSLVCGIGGFWVGWVLLP